MSKKRVVFDVSGSKNLAIKNIKIVNGSFVSNADGVEIDGLEIEDSEVIMENDGQEVVIRIAKDESSKE